MFTQDDWMAMQALLRSTRALTRKSWLAPFNDPAAVNRVLQRIHPLASIDAVRARIVSTTADGRDGSTIWLRPNRRWGGHESGQHVLLTADIDGVRQQRAFSLSASPRKDGLLRLSIRRSARSGVSNWLQTPQAVGAVVELSQARGEFVLPQILPGKFLLIAAGSGISPISAMLQQLAEQGYAGDIVLLHADRRREDMMLRADVSRLATRLPGLRVIEHVSSTAGRLSAASLPRLVSDLAERAWFVCGPEGLMEALRAVHTESGCSHPLMQERFGVPPAAVSAATAGQGHSVRVNEGVAAFAADPSTSLLQAAESAGLAPRFGCRAGICRTCLCQKRRGVVRNALTGVSSDTPDEWIQLCISSAQSDLEIDLDLPASLNKDFR